MGRIKNYLIGEEDRMDESNTRAAIYAASHAAAYAIVDALETATPADDEQSRRMVADYLSALASDLYQLSSDAFTWKMKAEDVDKLPEIARAHAFMWRAVGDIAEVLDEAAELRRPKATAAANLAE